MLARDFHRLLRRLRTAVLHPQEPPESLLNTCEIEVVISAHVAAAAVSKRPEFEGPVGSQIPALLQIFPQGRLHYCRYRGRCLLCLDVLVHRVRQVIRKSDRRSFHGINCTPFGEAGEIGDYGEY